MITVIAHYRTSASNVDRVRDLLGEHSSASEAEPGCLCFRAHQDAEDVTRFALYEQYRDLGAFRAHRASVHFRTNVEATLAPLLLDREWRMYGPRLLAR